MQNILRGSWWIAALLLAAGCRSEQAAFSFRPASGAVPVTAAIVASAPPAPALPAAPPQPALPQPAPPAAGPYVAALAAPITALTPAKAPTAQPGLRRQRSVASFRQLVAGRGSRAENAARTAHRDTLHWVLGGALVVAGVVGGILLGGWLGVGVGAALVLLGYYFLLMGLGGRQAWLEVFQEFFNM